MLAGQGRLLRPATTQSRAAPCGERTEHGPFHGQPPCQANQGESCESCIHLATQSSASHCAHGAHARASFQHACWTTAHMTTDSIRASACNGVSFTLPTCYRLSPLPTYSTVCNALCTQCGELFSMWAVVPCRSLLRRRCTSTLGHQVTLRLSIWTMS